MEEFAISELDGGERVISERIPGVRSVALGFWIGVGARDERGERAGVSHFIEHLLFKGSESYNAQEIAEIFDRMGGELNAATSREHTVVYTRVADQHVEQALAVMYDMVFAPTFDDLDQEREVVLEEIAMYEDTPQDLVHDLFSAAVFGTHALGRPVLGTADVISSVSRRAVAGFHRSAYTSGNVVIAAAGNLTHAKLVRLLQEVEAQREAPARGLRPRSLLVKTPPAGCVFNRKDTEQYHLCLGAPGVARSDPKRFAIAVLDSILGGSASSRLFQEIREKRGMAYAVWSFVSHYTDTGLVGVYLGTRQENVASCIEICLEQLGELGAGRFQPGELERAKESLKGRLVLSMESTSARMSRLGKSLVTETEILSLDRLMGEIDAVDADTVAELAAVLFASDRLSVSGIGPDEARFAGVVKTISPALAARAAA